MSLRHVPALLVWLSLSIGCATTGDGLAVSPDGGPGTPADPPIQYGDPAAVDPTRLASTESSTAPDLELTTTVETRSAIWPAVRGVTATAGERHVVVRFEPMPGADAHWVGVSRGPWDRDAVVEQLQANDGHLVHDALESGETYSYAVRARFGEIWTDWSVPATAHTRASELVRLSVRTSPPPVDDHDERGELVEQPELVRTLRELGRRAGPIPLFDVPVHRSVLSSLPPAITGRPRGDRLLVRSLRDDPTAMREALIVAMYEELGLPAPRTFHLERYLDEHFEGLYLGVERIDERALRRFGLAAQPFTIVRARPPLFVEGELPDDDEQAIALLRRALDAGRLDRQEWDALLELARWASAAPPGPQFAAELGQRLDVDRLLDLVAVHVIVQDLGALADDFWLYRERAGTRWIVLPAGGRTLTFGAVPEGASFFQHDRALLGTEGNVLLAKVMATPELRARLDARVIELVTERFDDAWFESRVGELASSIEPAVANVARARRDVGFWRPHLATLLDFVRLRRAFLLEVLALEGGAPNFARVEIEAADVGDVIPLVDSMGWVIAELRPSGAIGPIAIEARVEPAATGTAVDRRWTLHTSGPVAGDWWLYYRNSAEESWYRELTPAGAQWYLDATVDRADLRPLTLHTVTNPFSNRVALPIVLEPGETLDVILDVRSLE